MTNPAEQLKLERLDVVVQIYNKLFDAWYKLVTPPSLFAAGSVTVLCMYATIRNTDLPLLLYLIFPYMTVVITVIMFDICLDGVQAIIAAEDVLSRLKSTEMGYLSRMTVEEKMAMLKRAKALRIVSASVGIFGEYSMDVPVAAWDEIVNQIMFLLTL